MLRRLPMLFLVALAGCSHATLPYKPDPQPHGARVSAAYEIVGDRVRIEIDTSGKPLEQAWLFTSTGASVAPQAVDTPRVATHPGPSISIGAAGGSYGHHVGVGSGGSIGFPVGSSSRVEGNTVVWFPLASAGSPPWRLFVKLVGVEPTTFPVGGPPPA